MAMTLTLRFPLAPQKSHREQSLGRRSKTPSRKPNEHHAEPRGQHDTSIPPVLKKKKITIATHSKHAGAALIARTLSPLLIGQEVLATGRRPMRVYLPQLVRRKSER